MLQNFPNLYCSGLSTVFSDLALNYLSHCLQQGPQKSHAAPFAILPYSMYVFVTAREPRCYTHTAPIGVQQSLQPSHITQALLGATESLGGRLLYLK